MTKVTSNQDTAVQAVAHLSGLNPVQIFSRTEVQTSNLQGMKKGAETANEITAILSKYVLAVQEQAEKIPELAKVMATRDQETAFDFNVWQTHK